MAKTSRATTARTARRAAKAAPAPAVEATEIPEAVLTGEVLPPVQSAPLLLTHEPAQVLTLDVGTGLPVMVQEALAAKEAAADAEAREPVGEDEDRGGVAEEEEPAAEPVVDDVKVADPVVAAQNAKPVAEKKPKLDKKPTDMGRNKAEIEGNRRALELLVKSGAKGVTAREMADAAGFKSGYTTSLVRTLADRNGVAVEHVPGAKNLYRYRVVGAEGEAAPAEAVAA